MVSNAEILINANKIASQFVHLSVIIKCALLLIIINVNKRLVKYFPKMTASNILLIIGIRILFCAKLNTFIIVTNIQLKLSDLKRLLN